MFAWEVTVLLEQGTKKHTVQGEDLFEAIRQITEEYQAVIEAKRLYKITPKDPKRVPPKILVWADKTTDTMKPGYAAHAIAEDGSILVQQLIDGNNIEWVKSAMLAQRDEYQLSYPNGFEVLWIDKPSHDYRLIAARLASDHVYDFHTIRPNVMQMRSRRLRAVVGYVILVPELGTYYAVPLQDAPEPNDILPDPPYADPAQAARWLHRRHTEGI